MAGKPDLHPGMPSEIISATASIMDKLHELFAETGACAPAGLLFTVVDDQHQHHDLRFAYDENRGSGEYILVPPK